MTPDPDDIELLRDAAQYWGTRLIALAPSLARDHAALLDWAARAAEQLRWTDSSLSTVLSGKPHRAIAEVHSANAALLVEWDEMQERERKDA